MTKYLYFKIKEPKLQLHNSIKIDFYQNSKNNLVIGNEKL